MQEYKISHKNVIKIITSLEELPYKHVKYIIPFFESALNLIKEDENATTKDIQKIERKEEEK